MRGAKPSSGLVHLHKSFVELHFSGRLPQNVSIVPCVDGITLETVLPGQVYSTSCGQDHWLLGLQFIFKAYKEPVITHVERTGDSQITVAIATQGLQNKYTSDDPEQRAELQRAMEAAALKFAQAAVMRKAGRLQVSGPNINIPKKQLRAQWPAVLERLAPQEVTAHIFVDSTDAYIACAAKIILTKAKAEPVFYLSGLSQLLKSFMGAYVTMELMPNEQVVRLNIETGKSRQASLSTTAAAATGTASQADQVEASSAAVQPLCASSKLASTGTERGGRKRSCRSSQSGGAGSGACLRTAAAAMAAAATPQTASARATGAPAAAADIAVVKSSAVSIMQQTRDDGRSPAVDAADAPGTLLEASPPTARPQRQQQKQQQQQQALEGMASSNVGAMHGDSTPCTALQQIGPPIVMSADNSNCSSLRAPASSLGHLTSLKLAGIQAEAAGPVSLAAPATWRPGRAVENAVGGGAGAVRTAEPMHTMDGPASSGCAPGSDAAGLWLLADHAAQLQALGSTGSLSSAAAAAGAALPVAQRQRRQHRSGSRLGCKVAQPVGRGSSTVAEVASPAAGATAASSNPPIQVESIFLDRAAAAAIPVDSAVVASAAMAAAALPAVAAGLQTVGTSCCCCFGAEAGAMLATAEHAMLAAQHSVGFQAAAGGASGQSKRARVSSAAGAAVCVEQDCGQFESWQMYAKRRRTAHAAEDRDWQQHQQHYHGVPFGHVLGADMGHSAMYDRDTAAVGQYWHWDAAAMAARTDGGVHLVLHPDMEPLPFQHRHHGDFLKELPYNQLQQQPEQEQVLVCGAHLLAPGAGAPAVTSAGQAALVSHHYDVRALAQQHADQHGLAGAVAVVTRKSSDTSLAPHATQLQQQKLHAIRADAELEAALAAQQQMYWHGAAAHWHPAAMPVDSKASRVGPGAVDTAGHQLTAGAAPAEAVAITHTISQGAVGLQPPGGCAHVTLPELSPAKQPYLNSPGSNASSISRVPAGQGGALDSTLGSGSPALAAVNGASTVAAAAAAGASRIAISTGGSASKALADDACGMGCGAAQALQLQQFADQRAAASVREPNAASASAGAASHGLRSAAGTAKRAGSCSRIEGEAQREQPKQLLQQSPLISHNQTTAADVDQPGRQLVTAVLAAAASAAPDGFPQQQQAVQHAPGDPAAATVCPDGWPILPDADKLLAVGKALVQVMNLLGAGSEARLVLTRALRTMSPHDREWLLSITYPHLQDSCRRRAVPEMRMILNEVAGIDCFADAGAPPADSAGGVGAGRAC